MEVLVAMLVGASLDQVLHEVMTISVVRRCAIIFTAIPLFEQTVQLLASASSRPLLLQSLTTSSARRYVVLLDDGEVGLGDAPSTPIQSVHL